MIDAVAETQVTMGIRTMNIENVNTGVLSDSGDGAGSFLSTASLGNVSLEDVRSLNQNETNLYFPRCPDGTVVSHPTQNGGAGLCGDRSENGTGVESLFGNLTIEDLSA